MMIGVDVPWNAAWSSEVGRYEVRPCRWAKGKLAIWSPYSPGVGRPVFAKPHMVRQRRSIAQMLCTVCGEPTNHLDRYWFGLGRVQEGYFMTAEAPVHSACANIAMQVCPHLKKLGHGPMRFPRGASVMLSFVGGNAAEDDFGIKFNGRNVVGHMKLAWPEHEIPRLGVIGISVHRATEAT